jgi:hypothetical protein
VVCEPRCETVHHLVVVGEHVCWASPARAQTYKNQHFLRSVATWDSTKYREVIPFKATAQAASMVPIINDLEGQHMPLGAMVAPVRRPSTPGMDD